MPRFFTGPVTGPLHRITGPNAAHIAKSLRMRPGEALTLCDNQGMDSFCTIRTVTTDGVEVQVLDQHPNRSEPSVEVTLYQGIPKSDKMDLIVQKAVELGVHTVTPVITSRCVSRPDKKSMEKKLDRWGKIAEEAAKQSGRGRIPSVTPAMKFSEAIASAREQGSRLLFFYEGGGASFREAIVPQGGRYALFVGPEGGFSQEEAKLAWECEGKILTLGPRILRTETAPLAALSILMYATGNMEE